MVPGQPSQARQPVVVWALPPLGRRCLPVSRQELLCRGWPGPKCPKSLCRDVTPLRLYPWPGPLSAGLEEVPCPDSGESRPSAALVQIRPWFARHIITSTPSQWRTLWHCQWVVEGKLFFSTFDCRFSTPNSQTAWQPLVWASLTPIVNRRYCDVVFFTCES